MSRELNQKAELQKTWIYRLPSQLACFLIAICLVASQINPCDATSVAMGSSVTFILLAMGIGFLVAIDTLLLPLEPGADKLLRWLAVAFVMFGIWLWFCTALVPGRGNARFAYNGCWQWIAEGILTFSIAKLCLRLEVSTTWIALMLACAAGTVAHAAYKYFVSMPSIRTRFAADPNSFFSDMGIVAGSADAMQFANRLESFEPTGPFALTNSLAGLMAAWLLFLVVLFCSQAAGNFKTNERRWTSLSLGALLIGSFFVTLLLTKSRSAWLATLIGLIAACILLPTVRRSGWELAKRFRRYSVAIATLGVVAVGGILFRDPLIVLEAGKSLSYRLDYWRGAVALIESRPWTGYGVANFQQNYNRVKVMTASESPADPHNFVLETAIAGGLPLLAILLAILVILFWRLLDLNRDREQVLSSPFGPKTLFAKSGVLATYAGAMCGFLGSLVFGLLSNDFESVASILLFVTVSVLVFLLVNRFGWIVDNQNFAAVCLIAAWVVLVHLLASGGWMQPGVMNSLCVLVGIAFGGFFEKTANVTQVESKLRSAYPVAGLLLVSLAAVEFFRTMCLPVLASSAVTGAISNSEAVVQEPKEWLEIAKLDRFDPDLPIMAANQCVEVLRRKDLSATARQKYADVFEASCKEYLRREPNQWMPYADFGKWNAILADSEPSQNQDLESVVLKKELAYEYFSKAAEYYPNSAQVQLQAAVGAAWCGKNERAMSHLSRAEEIDRTTPHADRKIAAVSAFFPRQLESTFGPLEGKAKMGQQPGFAKGEPVLQWLRTNVR